MEEIDEAFQLSADDRTSEQYVIQYGRELAFV